MQRPCFSLQRGRYPLGFMRIAPEIGSGRWCHVVDMMERNLMRLWWTASFFLSDGDQTQRLKKRSCRTLKLSESKRLSSDMDTLAVVSTVPISCRDNIQAPVLKVRISQDLWANVVHRKWGTIAWGEANSFRTHKNLWSVVTMSRTRKLHLSFQWW